MGLKVIFIDFIFIILLHHGYSQLDCGLNNQCTERICTGLTRKITCKSGGVLSITGAFFGRTSTIDCKNPSGTITDCVPNATLAESQLDNAKRLCDNETECTLKASFNFQDECKVDVWGDPCPSKSKYIVVNFTCISTGALNFWTEWSNWGACSKSCDAGVRTRTRNCVDPPKKSCTKSTCKGRSYPDVETATQSCNLGVCPASSSKSPPSTSIETSSSTSRIPPSTSSTSYSTLTSTSTASSTLLPASSSFSPTPVIPTTSSYSPSASNSAPSETGIFSATIVMSSIPASTLSISSISSPRQSATASPPSPTSLIAASASFMASSTSKTSLPSASSVSSSSSLPIISSQVEEKVSTSIKIAPTTRRESVSTSATIKTRLFTPSIEVSMVLSSSNSPQRSISASNIKSMSLISISDSMVVTSSTTEPIATLLPSSTEVQTSPTIEVTLSTSRSTPALKSSSYQIGSSASTILSVTKVLPPSSTLPSVTRSSRSATKSSTSASKSSTSASKSLTSIEATPTKSSTSSSSTKSETQSSTTPTKSIEPSPSTSTVMSSSVAVLPPTKETTEKPKTTTQSNTTSKPTDSPITNATTEGLNTNATTKKPTDTPLTSTSLPTTKEPTIATTERLYTTDSPDKPDFYGNVTLTMLWKDFCKYSPEFREGLAKVLSKNVEKSTGADQVIVMNLGNCKSSPDETAVVKFYISYKSSKEPNKDLTNAAVVELLKLLQGGDTAEIGKHFGNGTFTHVVFVVHDDHDEDDWPIWLIILIIVASLIFLLWLCCCCWIFCGKKEKEPVKRKYTFQHIDPLGIPHVKISDENGNAKPTYTSTMTVTVRPKSPAATHFDNPAYEMNEYPPTPSFGFRPVNVKLVNLKSGDDSDIEKKPDSGSDSSSDDEKSPPSPETTKVYLDGKLVQEIPVLEKATEL
ncbi:mucin-2-like isoform X12 [Hydractinia symbiolongicarpus]|uniref:mucin-2-like isoform X12 n=1 Tax=Hydractinia symbiolongicarpus TaxID=13093 RepID=UPI00254A5EF6|nr:mucin-2-like isoform X12 [Hydractinia symbiolongicarpus]